MDVNVYNCLQFTYHENKVLQGEVYHDPRGLLILLGRFSLDFSLEYAMKSICMVYMLQTHNIYKYVYIQYKKFNLYMMKEIITLIYVHTKLEGNSMKGNDDFIKKN